MKKYDILLESLEKENVSEVSDILVATFALSQDEAASILDQIPIILWGDVEMKDASLLVKQIQRAGCKIRWMSSDKERTDYARVVWPDAPLSHQEAVSSVTPRDDDTQKIAPPKKTRISKPKTPRSKKVKGMHIGIEFNTGVLKIFQFIENKGPRPQDLVAAYDIRGDNDDVIASKIQEHSDGLVRDGTRVVGLIPRELTTVRNAQFPSTDPKELAQMVSYQAVKMVPFGRENMVIDFQVLSTTTEGYSEVMIFIIRRDILDRILRIYQMAHVFPDRLSVNIAEIYAALQYYMERVKGSDITTLLLLDLDFCTTNIILMDQGHPHLTRSIDGGLVHLMDDTVKSSQAIQSLVSEVQTTLTAGRNILSGQKLKRIFIVANDRVCSKLVPHFERFETPTENIEPMSWVHYGGERREGLLGENVSFMALSGLVMQKKQRLINLMPKELLEKRNRSLQKKEWRVIGSVIVMIVAMLALIFYTDIRQWQDYKDVIEGRIQSHRMVAGKIELMMRRIDLMKAHQKSNTIVLDVITELYQLAPSNVYLTVFEYNDDGRVQIKGSAKQRPEVWTFDQRLRDSDLFVHTELVDDILMQRSRTGETFNFTIHGRLDVSR